MFTCPKCKTTLIKGREHTFPPRLFYWYCPQCQQVYEENRKGSEKETEARRYIKLVGKVKDHKDECIQDYDSMGCVRDDTTGKISYPGSADEKSMNEVSNDIAPPCPGDV